MSTQPLTKSDWDGHPVWWVRLNQWSKERMAVMICDEYIETSASELTYQELAQDGWQRSHDRINWEPCSRKEVIYSGGENPFKPQPDTVDVEKLIEVASRLRILREAFMVGSHLRPFVDEAIATLAALHPRLKAEVER